MKPEFCWLTLVLGLALVPFRSPGIIAEGGPGELDPGRPDLRPLGAVSREEKAAFDSFLSRFSRRMERDDFSAPEAFLREFPGGAWAPAVRLRLAEEYYATGWYSKAVDTLEGLWAERGRHPAPEYAVVAAHAGVQLVELYARLGKRDEVENLVSQLEQATPAPEDVETLRGVRQGLATMRRFPEISFRCGALALERIRVFLQTTNAGHAAILESRSSPLGMTLAEVADLSRQTGMDYQMAYRSRGARWVTPAVAHLRIGHFVALPREHRGKVQVEDPTGWQTIFASHAALDNETSGYFLVPAGPLPPGWRVVEQAEGAAVWGRNGVLDSDPDGSGKRDRKGRCGAGGGSSFGMATWDVHLMLVSQQIIDTPLRYEPPFGPPIEITFRHTQRANRRFGYRPIWTHNWTGQIYENPRSPLGDLWLHEEGGWERFSPLDDEGKSYQGRIFNNGRLVRQDAKTLLWQFADGTTRTYTTFSDANVSWGRIFYLSAIADAAGNQVNIGLLPSGRVESVTDPLGQVTRFYYELSDPGLPPSGSSGGVVANWDSTNQITRVVDPFGRSVQLQYAKVVRTIGGFCSGPEGSYPCPFSYYNYDLTNIVDMGGLSSQFAYDGSGLLVTNLTTPYGVTRFNWMSRSVGDYALEVTDGEGNAERFEYMPYGSGGIDAALWKRPRGMRTDGWGAIVAHWDQQAYAQSRRDGSLEGATLYMFQLSETLASAGRVLMAIKKPLENPVWFNYPGQGSPLLPGMGDLPNSVGRVLEDGSTQLWRTERDAWGNPISRSDPLGRTTEYFYAPNRVDLLEARQVGGNRRELLVRATWNDQHLPLTVTDAAGGTTRMTYNSRGQVTSVTDALGGLTSYTYDPKGYLTGVDGPQPGAQDRNTFTYDTVGRIRTATDSDGYAITMDYDLFDRVTRIRFPDGTAQEFVYDRLDVGVVRDRLGRETRYTRDAFRRITALEDALGRVTRLQWCGCGGLAALIDPLGRMTRWHRDLQGRVVAKEFADGSRITYEYERATSRLWRKRDGQEQITEFRYDLDDALVSQTYLNARRPTPNVTFTYDSFYPRLESMTDGDGSTLFRYHPVDGTPGAGRIAVVDGPWADDEIAFEYDALGRLVSRAIHGVAMRRAYDSMGRVTRLTNALGEFNFTFDGATERLATIGYPNGQRGEFTYSGNLREQLLERATHFLPNGAKLSEFTYGYNARGMITNWTQFQSGRLKTWVAAYDPANRLTNIVETIAGEVAAATSWAYDAADNRIQERVRDERRDFSFNSLNQLTGLSGNAPVSPSTYEWDAENRLVGISNATAQIEFGYDGLDRRTRVTIRNGGTVVSDRRYLWCGDQLCEERDASGSRVLKRYSSHGVLNVAAPELPAGAYFLTRDHLGSVREMTSAAGVASVYDYTAYGQQTQLAGGNRVDFGFTGFFQPAGASVPLALYRGYSPVLGQWLSRDPGGERGGINLLAYAKADPLNYFDPDGFEPNAAKLVNKTQGYKDAKAGMDSYDTAKKVAKTIEKVGEDGLKETINGEMEDKAKDAIPKGGIEEYKPLLDNAERIKEEGVNPLLQAWRDLTSGVNNGLSGKCDTPKPKRSPKPKQKAVEQEKGLWDTFLDIIGWGEKPPTPEPDGPIKIKDIMREYRTSNADSY